MVLLVSIYFVIYRPFSQFLLPSPHTTGEHFKSSTKYQVDAAGFCHCRDPFMTVINHRLVFNTRLMMTFNLCRNKVSTLYLRVYTANYIRRILSLLFEILNIMDVRKALKLSNLQSQTSLESLTPSRKSIKSQVSGMSRKQVASLRCESKASRKSQV